MFILSQEKEKELIQAQKENSGLVRIVTSTKKPQGMLVGREVQNGDLQSNPAALSTAQDLRREPVNPRLSSKRQSHSDMLVHSKKKKTIV